RPEADGAVAGDAAELVLHLADRDAGAEAERDEAADGLGVGHGGAAGLAEGAEDLERAAVLVLVDRDVEVAERADHLHGVAAERGRTLTLLARGAGGHVVLAELGAQSLVLEAQVVRLLTGVGDLVLEVDEIRGDLGGYLLLAGLAGGEHL